MATPLSVVYDAFLAKVEADDWMMNEYWDEVEKDWRQILDQAIFPFRYSRIPLDHDDVQFTNDLTNDEVQVLANLMKLQWVERCVATWENLRQMYSTSDYSMANFLQKLNATAQRVNDDCRYMIDRYGRSEHYKPNSIFGRLAGK